jgi:putative ABC transport system permease protein
MPESAGAIDLGPVELAVAACLVLVAGGVSLALGLGLERRLALASARTVVQLLLVGYVLERVFRLGRVGLLLPVLGVMVVAAGWAAVRRSERTFRGIYPGSIGTLALTGTVTTFTVTAAVIGVEPWWRAQYVLPLLGMVLGNGLTGISLTLDSFLASLDEQRGQVETELALGASRWEAARRPLSDAVRRGMIPIINAMMVVGVVSLPGMMTGQILAGADPLKAVKYQIVVMFMLAAATSLGCVAMALLVYHRLFNGRHQLRAERIHRRGGTGEAGT